MLDPNAVDAARKLMAAGYEVYVVGGAMRDLIMGYPCNDFDLATNAPNPEIERLLDEVTFHDVGDMTFAFAHYPDEIVDVATFYNIPRAFHGQPGIPEFDPEVRTTDQAMMDSFRRDITINALYYDMSNGDLVSWQGGLYDLREGLINTLTDPDVVLNDDPNIAIRALRFKARYGYAFSERLESAFRLKGEAYIGQITPDLCAFHLPKLFNGGYAAASFSVLTDYGVFDSLFPLGRRSDRGRSLSGLCGPRDGKAG